MNKDKTYLVFNYSKSPVGVRTRNDSYIIEGGNSESPASMPFTIDEIVQINNGSEVFKSGLLRFEKEYEAEIYEELRIRDWQDIMTDDDIETILKNPSVENLKKIIAIKSEFYFERIYGVYMGLFNAGFPISQNVQNILRGRRYEFAHNRLTSQIPLEKPTNENVKVRDEVDELKTQNENMAKQLAEMKAMMDKMSANKTENVNPMKEVETTSLPTKKPGRPKKTTK